MEKSLLDLNGLEADEEADKHPGPLAMTDEKSVVGSRGSEADFDSTNNNHIFKGFPESLDESSQSSILENIDAAIYENQIIFRERIRKNQLTIQNLKLQDQLLSQFMDLNSNGLPNSTNLEAILHSLEEQRRHAIEAFGMLGERVDDVGLNSSGDPNTSMGYLSTRDYENMSYDNSPRSGSKMKQRRNYVQNIQEGGNLSTSSEMAEAKVDDLYMVMQPANKNILVETINQINDNSTPTPMKQEPQENVRRQSLETVEFDCGIAGALLPTREMGPNGLKLRKEGKQVPGLYYYNLNNIPLDSILESNCEDNWDGALGHLATSTSINFNANDMIIIIVAVKQSFTIWIYWQNVF